MLAGAAGVVALTALGTARFAGDGVGIACQCRDGLGHAHHALLHQVKGIAPVFDDIHDLRLGLLQDFARVGVQDGLDKVGTVAGAPVGDGARISCQLHRRDDRVALADGGLHFQRGRVVGVVFRGQAAQCLADLHARALAQAQLIGISVVDVTGHPAAHIVEEDVAAPFDGRDDVDVAVAGALGVVILEVVVHAVAVYRGIPVDDAGVQRGNGHRGLIGRARGVQALQRPVEQRHPGVGAVLAVLGGVEVLVKAGVVGGGQHAAVLDIQHHHRACIGPGTIGAVGPADHINVFAQRLLHRFLEIAVDGELDGVARLRHRGHGRADDDAIRVAGDGLHTILAPQLVLIGRFQARDADDIVHIVAFIPQRIGGLAVFIGHFPLFRRNLAHPAQHMGQHRALLIAAGGGLHDLHARQGEAVFLDGGHGHIADVFGHDKVVDVGERLLLHLIMDAAQHPLPVEGVGAEVIVLHQFFHHVISGGVLLQAQALFHVGKALLVAGAVLRSRKRVVAVGIRLADEEGVVPALAVLLQQLHDPLQHGVQILAAHQQLAEHHIVAGGAGRDPFSLAVHDVAAGRRDRKIIVRGVGGAGFEAVAIDQLQKDQPEHIQPHDDRRKGDEQPHPAHNGLVFVQIHLVSSRRGRLRSRSTQTTPLSILNSMLIFRATQ